jgi:hypothetical protein
MRIRGYAAKYNSDSGDLGGFVESIEPGAFDAVVRSNPDVVALFNHNPDHILGRTPSTLTLRSDKVGLLMDLELPDTELGRSIFQSVERGDLKGQSFAFSDFEATWNEDYSRRSISRINQLYDVGPVTYPAYDDTSVSARDRERAIEESRKAAPSVPATPAQVAKTNKGIHIMKTPQEHRAEAQGFQNKVTAIQAKASSEDRDLTPEEVEEIASLNEETAQHQRTAEVLERNAQIAADLQKPAAPIAQPDVPEQRKVAPAPRAMATLPLKRNLRSFTPEVYGTTKAANDTAYRCGMFWLSTFENHMQDEARAYCQANGVQRAMGINVGTKGGYLVPDEMEQAVINVIDKFGVARSACRLHTMSADTKNVPIRDSGLTAYAIGENSAITSSDKAWSTAELVARKWGVLVKYSSEISEDSIISIADDLAEEIGSAIADKQDDSWLNGDGTSTYHGMRGLQVLMEADTWSGSLFDAASAHDTLAEVDADDLAQLYGKMLDKYRPGSAWLCSPFTKAVVFDAIMAAAGGNMNAQLAAGQPATYMGYPIITSEKMYAPATASTVANDKVPIMFGRFDIGSSLGERRGLTVATSADRYFPEDQLAIRGTMRFDISNHNANCGTSVGPIVGLALTT